MIDLPASAVTPSRNGLMLDTSRADLCEERLAADADERASFQAKIVRALGFDQSGRRAMRIPTSRAAHVGAARERLAAIARQILEHGLEAVGHGFTGRERNVSLLIAYPLASPRSPSNTGTTADMCPIPQTSGAPLRVRAHSTSRNAPGSARSISSTLFAR